RAAGQARCKLSLGECVERPLDLLDRAEVVEALRALLELPERLRPAEHQHAEDRQLVCVQPERLVEQVPVFGCTATRPARKPRPASGVDVTTSPPVQSLPRRALSFTTKAFPSPRRSSPTNVSSLPSSATTRTSRATSPTFRLGPHRAVPPRGKPPGPRRSPLP